ncbi:MAG: PAS domain S-box protein [Phycisphaerae bacterium]|nr:PAS domain S-box protein [Phycisphaerae bacterium]
MISAIILGASVVLQAISVVLALRLVRLTRRTAPWVLISLGFVLIIFRRSISIIQMTAHMRPVGPFDVYEAVLNLMLSAFFLLGVLRIRPQFEAMLRTEGQLREAGAQLELRVQQRTAELTQTVADLRREIDSRQRAEQSVLESERKYRALVETTHTGYLILDAAGKVVDANAEYVRLSGHGLLDEIVGREVTEWTAPRDRERNAAEVAKCLREGSTHDLVVDYVDRRGHVTPVEVQATVLRTGDSVQIVSLCRDIAERNLAETTLRQSEAHNRALLQAIPDQIVRVSREGVYLEAVTPPGFESVWTPGQCIGKTVHELLPPDRARRLADAIERAYRTQEMQGLDYAVAFPDGRTRYREARFVRAGDDVLAVVRDITDRKQAEDQLRTTNAMLEELTGQLRALAVRLTRAERQERHRVAVLIHDQVQQLLAAAKVRTGILSQQVADANALATVAQIKDLLNEAIGISRSLAYEISPPVMREIGLAAALDWLAESMQDKHGLSVQVRSEGEIREDPDGVCDLLYQCVRELLLNVVKHAGVSAATMDVRRLADDRVQIVVDDRGLGFSPADLANAGGGSNSGFGLFSIRERLQLLGGELTIDSVPGRGSRFILEAPLPRPATQDDSPAGLPVAAGQSEAPSHAGSEEPANRPIRVLLADDHMMMRQGLADILGNYDDIEMVGQAADGAEAVRLAMGLVPPPDVVVMDVRMPGMNGLDATRRLKAAMPGVQVIGLSLHDDPKTAAAMREAGAAAFLAKGGPIESLVAAVRAVSSVGKRPGEPEHTTA